MKLNEVKFEAEFTDEFELLLTLVLLTKGGRVPLVAGGADPLLPDPLLPDYPPLDELLLDTPELGA